jgi:hypothetical protein
VITQRLGLAALLDEVPVGPLLHLADLVLAQTRDTLRLRPFLGRRFKPVRPGRSAFRIGFGKPLVQCRHEALAVGPRSARAGDQPRFDA